MAIIIKSAGAKRHTHPTKARLSLTDSIGRNNFCFLGRPKTMNYLLEAQIGTSVRDAAWSFALPQSKGGTHDKSQTHRRGRSHFYCARRTCDGSARSSPPGTTKREHLLCDD